MPFQDELSKLWKLSSWKDHVDKIWRTKNQLMEKEKEYRDAAYLIIQVGIGMGGLLIGLISLIISSFLRFL